MVQPFHRAKERTHALYNHIILVSLRFCRIAAWSFFMYFSSNQEHAHTCAHTRTYTHTQMLRRKVPAVILTCCLHALTGCTTLIWNTQKAAARASRAGVNAPSIQKIKTGKWESLKPLRKCRLKCWHGDGRGEAQGWTAGEEIVEPTLWGFHQDDCQKNKGLADLSQINEFFVKVFLTVNSVAGALKSPQKIYWGPASETLQELTQ